jgi:hypothetical protein
MKGIDHDPSIPQGFRTRHRPGRPFAESKFPCAVKRRGVSAGVTPARPPRQASTFQPEGSGAVSGGNDTAEACGEILVREPDAGELHVRFDERQVATEPGRAGEPPPRHTKEPDG